MHHAHLLIGNRDWALSHIPEEYRVRNLDVSVLEFERMSIADVRSLIYESNLKPVASSERVFVLLCDSILHESQNALLKLFEDPQENVIFYFVVPRADMLLPTLRSRLQLLATEEEKYDRKAFTDFLKATYKERLQIVGERLTAEDQSWVSSMIKGFVQNAHERRNPTLMNDALVLERYIQGSGHSKKMILEHIALTL